MLRESLTPVFSSPVVSNRLIVRKIKDSDAPAFVDAFQENDYEMKSFFIFPEEFFPDRDFTLSTIFPAMKYFERSQNMHYLAAFRIGAPENMLGMVICNYDRNNFIRAGYFIKSSERRKGYGSEMYTALMQTIGSMTGQTSMRAEVLKDNKASLAMLRSLGFRTQGIHVSTNDPSEGRRMIALTRGI